MVSFNPYFFSVRNDFEVENPYLCECGTFLNLRARVKQLNDSGRLMYEAKMKFAHSQCLDSRLIENDSFDDVADDDFDAIDALKATDSLNEKLSVKNNASDASTSVEDKKDSKNIDDADKTSVEASE